MPDGHLPKPTLSPGREIINLELKGPIDGAKPQVLFNSRSSSLRVSSITLVSNMRKYPTCEVHHEIHAIGIFAAAAGDVAVVRAYIEGFN